MAEQRRKVTSAASALERLRGVRVRGDRDTSLSSEIGKQRRTILRTASAVGDLNEAWDAVAPVELRGRAGATGLSRGVLTIEADNQAARYLVDRWLRAGGEALVVARAGAAVRRVKVVAGR